MHRTKLYILIIVLMFIMIVWGSVTWRPSANENNGKAPGQVDEIGDYEGQGDPNL